MSQVLGLPSMEVKSTPQDSGYICVRCGYNLTGLTSSLCPECAWQIDWRLAGLDEERRREGTAAHRARGWRKIDQTVVTVLTMLFMPWRFARQVRGDEGFGPSLVVAGLFPVIVMMAGLKDWRKLGVESGLLLGVLTVILCQSMVFATLHRSSAPRSPGWVTRFRRWLIVSLYTTCFVYMWPVAGCAPIVQGPVETNFFWPPAWILHGSAYWKKFGLTSDNLDGWSLGVSIIFYWWWAILTTVLIVRQRPRWLVPILIPLVLVFSWVGTVVVIVILP